MPAAAIGPTAAGSGERVSQVERLEFPGVTVIGVQRADAVLEQDSCDMSVRDQVAANRCLARYMLVGFYETVQLGHGTHVRQPDERGDVPERFVRRQRC
jgi:hypothetical protein